SCHSGRNIGNASIRGPNCSEHRIRQILRRRIRSNTRRTANLSRHSGLDGSVAVVVGDIEAIDADVATISKVDLEIDLLSLTQTGNIHTSERVGHLGIGGGQDSVDLTADLRLDVSLCQIRAGEGSPSSIA